MASTGEDLSSTTFDVIVLGAGIMGLSTGLACVEASQSCLILEQFPFPHSRGSSTGHSRITRQAYPESSVISKMMLESHEGWRHIEAETSTKLYQTNGMIYVDREPSKKIKKTIDSMSKLGYDFQLLTSEDLHEKYGEVISYQGYQGLFDPTGGVLRADLCNAKTFQIYQRKGGRLVDSQQISEIIPGSPVEVRTRSGKTFFGRSLVVAAGSWTGPLLKEQLGLDLPLQPEAVSVCYWKVHKPELFSPSRFPCLIDIPDDFWAVPCLEYPGCIKLVVPRFNERLSTPELRDRTQRPVEQLASLYEPYLKAHFPGVVQPSPPCIVERCLYTTTPDEMWIIDRHPKIPNIIILAGFSGHGFKAGPVVGKVASELVTQSEQRYDLSVFSLNRFNKN